jgi:hypothetical protein
VGSALEHHTSDARGTTLDSGGDGPLLGEAESDAHPSVDMEVRDTLASADANPDAISPQDVSAADAAPPDARAPGCIVDSDCGDARRCIDEVCEELLCRRCRNSEVCLQGCCQPLPQNDDLAECTHPITMNLGEMLTDANSDFVWRNRWTPSCSRTNSPEIFGQFIPEVTDTYCIQLAGEVTTATLFLQLNCCNDESEIACDAATGLDQRAQIERVLHVGVDYRLGVQSGSRALSAVITRGACGCVDEDDCATVHVCTEGQCIDRRGQPCDDNAPCGRRSVCRRPGPVCAEDI